MTQKAVEPHSELDINKLIALIRNYLLLLLIQLQLGQNGQTEGKNLTKRIMQKTEILYLVDV